MDITNKATWLLLAVTWLIPLVSNLVKREKWPVELTGILTLVLSALGGFLSEWAAHPAHYQVGWAVVKAAATYVLAAVAHEKIWKATRTDQKTLAWPRKLPAGDHGQVGLLLLVLIVVALLTVLGGFFSHPIWFLLIVLILVGAYALSRD